MLKIYTLELISPIRDKDKSLLLSELHPSEIKLLPNQQGIHFDLSLTGKALAKKIIFNETRTTTDNILIGKTKLGKPVIKKPANLNLDMSISHSGNYLVVGICDSGKIGVDIELVKETNFGLLRNCLSVGEENYINLGDSVTQRLERFYEIWTRKEAYLKALGIGLRKPLPITQFYLDDIKPRSEIKHDNQHYYLSTLKEDKFILSVCTTSLVSYYQSYTKLTLDKLCSHIFTEI